MTRRLSLLIAWTCTALLIALPCACLYLLTDLSLLQSVVHYNLDIPILWDTVLDWQWYSEWVLSVLFLSIGLTGVFYLRRAFTNFARGELFSFANSNDLQRFAKLLLLQTLISPLHFGLSSLLLSLNHPAGQKMLSIAFGSGEFRAIGVALILWVMSNLLLEGCKLHSENQQFV